MEKEIIYFLSEDEEQAITLKWELLWTKFRKKLKENKQTQQRYRRACRMLGQYAGKYPTLILRNAVNMSFFFDLKAPADFAARRGEIYWGEAASALYKRTLDEITLLHDVSNTQRIHLNPLTIINAFASPQKFDTEALRYIVDAQSLSNNWSPRSKKWMAGIVTNNPNTPVRPKSFPLSFIKKILRKDEGSR